MIDDNWIDARDALRLVRAAGFTEFDLTQWAEAGKLHARAKRGRFSGDDDFFERQLCLPTKPEELEKELARRFLTGNPWPDVPSDFWHHLNLKHNDSEAHWGAGVFATTVYFETKAAPNGGNERIKLLDVTFNLVELQELITTTSGEQLVGVLPSNATPANKREEKYAHMVAELVRTKGYSVAKACAKIDENHPTSEYITPESRQKAIRVAYGLMYQRNGYPHPK
jgi:hypothetical protein